MNAPLTTEPIIGGDGLVHRAIVRYVLLADTVVLAPVCVLIAGIA